MSKYEDLRAPHNELLGKYLSGESETSNLRRIQSSFAEILGVINEPAGWIPVDKALQMGLALPNKTFALIRVIETSPMQIKGRPSAAQTEDFKVIPSSARADVEKLLTLDESTQKQLGIGTQINNTRPVFQGQPQMQRVSFKIADSL